MSDNHTDSSVIESIIGIHIKKRILKDTGGETNFIGSRIVISIHSLRSHSPLVTIYRLTGLCQFIIEFKLSGTFHICPIRVFFNIQSRIISPLIGVAHFHIERIQLLDGFGFSTVAHPFQVLDAFAQRRLQVLDQLHHTFFGGSGEVFFHIHLSYRFTQHAVHCAHRTFPARLVFFSSR